MSWFTRLIVLVLLVAGVFLALNQFYPERVAGMLGAKTGFDSQAFVQEYEAEHGSDFLTYENANYSLKLKYPIGFYAEEEPDWFALARFTGASPFGYEVIELKTADGEDAFTVAELQEAFSSPSGEFGFTGEETEVNGVKAFLFDGGLVVYGETYFVKGGAFVCPGYTALVTVAAPGALAQDWDFARYVLYSFSC
jgi:hypothetical protein